MAEGGYTPRETDKFTLGDANLLFDYWSRNPGIRMMLAGFFGLKPKPPGASLPALATETPITSIAAIRAQFPDGIMR